MSRTRVKVCCISSLDEAAGAVAAGADAVGLVAHMPSGPGVIPEPLIAEIAAAVPPPVATFLLTSETDPEAIAAQQRRCGCTTLQLVDRLEPDDHRRLRRLVPGVKLVQVIHVTGSESVAEARAMAAEVDALLLDSGNPALAVKELGGTGRVHDWDLSREIVDAVAVPVFLAGGLGPDNAAEAVARVRPYGLDLCSGVRRDGRLDRGLLTAFMAAVAGT